ncbi:MAG: hypothetical protein ACP5PP_04850 [Fervidobacterium sp.]
MAAFIFLGVLLFLIPMANIKTFEYKVKIGNQGVISSITSFIRKSGENTYAGQKYYPNSSVKSKETISIDIKGKVIVEFIEDGNVAYPNVLELKKYDNLLKITGGKKDSTYVIKIGTDVVKNLELSSVDIEMSGSAKLDTLKASGVSVKISGDFSAVHLEADGTRLELKGTFNSSNMTLDGVGVELYGNFYTRRVEIDGVGIKSDIDLHDCEKMTVSGTGVNGSIRYFGNQDLSMELEVLGGTVTVENHSSADLKIHSSVVKVVRK